MKTNDDRIEMPDYPERAVLEGIVNALIHRSYLEIGSEVHIDMYDNRLEIYSPGGMVDGSNVQDLNLMNISSKRRNPIIADIFGRLSYMDRRGSGFRKIIESYESQPNYTENLNPTFISDNGQFILGLCNLNYINSDAKETSKKTSKKTRDLIIEFISNDPYISVSEIASEIGISVAGINYHMEKLKFEKAIQRVGPDKGGYWQVINTK